MATAASRNREMRDSYHGRRDHDAWRGEWPLPHDSERDHGDQYCQRVHQRGATDLQSHGRDQTERGGVRLETKPCAQARRSVKRTMRSNMGSRTKPGRKIPSVARSAPGTPAKR